VPVADPAEAGALEEHLLRRGIVPRTFGPRHLLRGQLRFTVRDRAQDDRLLAALAEWMKTRRTP
jgi:histidinol-phosphate/aromatic aminotransferase/cobyric acid decarboxylase-like protein